MKILYPLSQIAAAIALQLDLPKQITRCEDERQAIEMRRTYLGVYIMTMKCVLIGHYSGTLANTL